MVLSVEDNSTPPLLESSTKWQQLLSGNTTTLPTTEILYGTKTLLNKTSPKTTKQINNLSTLLTSMGFSHDQHLSPFYEDEEAGGNGGILNLDIACSNSRIGVNIIDRDWYVNEGEAVLSDRRGDGELLEEPRLNGSGLMRTRLVEKLGWRYIGIPVFEWEKMRTKEQRLGYLDERFGPIFQFLNPY